MPLLQNALWQFIDIVDLVDRLTLVGKVQHLVVRVRVEVALSAPISWQSCEIAPRLMPLARSIPPADRTRNEPTLDSIAAVVSTTISAETEHACSGKHGASSEAVGDTELRSLRRPSMRNSSRCMGPDGVDPHQGRCAPAAIHAIEDTGPPPRSGCNHRVRAPLARSKLRALLDRWQPFFAVEGDRITSARRHARPTRGISGRMRFGDDMVDRRSPCGDFVELIDELGRGRNGVVVVDATSIDDGAAHIACRTRASRRVSQREELGLRLSPIACRHTCARLGASQARRDAAAALWPSSWTLCASLHGGRSCRSVMSGSMTRDIVRSLGGQSRSWN